MSRNQNWVHLKCYPSPNGLTFILERYEDNYISIINHSGKFISFFILILLLCWGFTLKGIDHTWKHTFKNSVFRSVLLREIELVWINTQTAGKRQDGGRLHCLREAINTDPVRKRLCLSTHTHTHQAPMVQTHIQTNTHTNSELENHQSLFRPYEKFNNSSMFYTVSQAGTTGKNNSNTRKCSPPGWPVCDKTSLCIKYWVAISKVKSHWSKTLDFNWIRDNEYMKRW